MKPQGVKAEGAPARARTEGVTARASLASRRALPPDWNCDRDGRSFEETDIGELVGNPVGVLEGRGVGKDEGKDEGKDDGEAEGSAVGMLEGDADGIAVGELEGSGVGALEGMGDGSGLVLFVKLPRAEP